MGTTVKWIKLRIKSMIWNIRKKKKTKKQSEQQEKNPKKQ